MAFLNVPYTMQTDQPCLMYGMIVIMRIPRSITKQSPFAMIQPLNQDSEEMRAYG